MLWRVVGIIQCLGRCTEVWWKQKINTLEENSSVFSLIQIHQFLSAVTSFSSSTRSAYQVHFDVRFLNIMISHTHAHPFNGPLSRTTRVRPYQKDFTKAWDSEWQWHQLGHMQVCTSLQTDNHARTPPLSFYRPDALPATQPTASKHWRQWWFQ